jgi:hypothetical protein
MIKSRFNIKEILRDCSIGCELGVFEGDFSEVLLQTEKFDKLYLVDLFDGIVESGDTRGNNVKVKGGSDLQNLVLSRFSGDARVSVIKSDSISFLKDFKDEYFDFIYIDTTHQYEQTKNELNLAFDKVKKGGVIAGHDHNQQQFYGVYSAVNEFSEAKKLPLNLTSEDHLETFYFFKQ